MNDRLIAACAHAVEDHLKELFDNAPRIPRTGMAEIPLVGGPFLLGLPVPPELYQRVFAALCSHERFRQDEPGWPDLPLHKDLHQALINADCVRANVLGYYSRSLAGEGWNYELHPHIAVFASGLMASEDTPIEIRNDRSLLEEFPPRELAGLHELYWDSPATLAWRQDTLARVAAFEAARAVELVDS
jgi:hypothetical protein